MHIHIIYIYIYADISLNACQYCFQLYVRHIMLYLEYGTMILESLGSPQSSEKRTVLPGSAVYTIYMGLEWATISRPRV